MAKKKDKRVDSVNETSGVIMTDKKKKKRGGLIVLLLILFLLIVIITGILAFIFNWFKVKQTIVDWAMDNDQGYVEERLRTADDEIAAAEAMRAQAESTISTYENRIADLSNREAQVQERESNLALAQEELLSGQTPVDARTSLINMFEKMDRAAAAETLQRMNDPDTVAGILSEMKNKAAAEIMDEFPADYAATVARRML